MFSGFHKHSSGMTSNQMVDACNCDCYKPVKYFYDKNSEMYVDPEAMLVEEPQKLPQTNSHSLKLKVSYDALHLKG